MKPTVGRIVLFWPFMEKPDERKESHGRAAIITYVHSDTMVNLHVFGQDHNDDEAGVQTSVDLVSGENQSYCWSWPPRV